MSWAITTFYQFQSLNESEILELTDTFTDFGETSSLCGLIILASEGINGTVAALEDDLLRFKDILQSQNYFQGMLFKDSSSTQKPFRRFSVQTRDQIVNLRGSEQMPCGINGHLSPQEWQALLDSEEEVILLDTRNWYETQLGKFREAVDLQLETFSDFIEAVQKQQIPKDKKILMYCTGGIRCEKASIEMQKQGYTEVYQLDGGILNYFAQYQQGDYEGECFVFDHRVAVRSDLQPSLKYSLCPHCGNPAEEKVQCKLCQKEFSLCDDCQKVDSNHTCSKNCAHHYVRLMKAKSNSMTENRP